MKITRKADRQFLQLVADVLGEDLEDTIEEVVVEAKGGKVTSLSLRALRKADLRGTHLDFSQLDALSELKLHAVDLGKLDLSACSKLKALRCFHSSIRELRLPPKLELLHLLAVPIGSLDLRGQTKLEDVELLSCRLRSVDFSPLVACTGLWFSGNALRPAQIVWPPHPENIYNLSVSGNRLGELDLSRFPNLEVLLAGNCGLSTIDFSPCPALAHVVVGMNKLKKIDTSMLPGLTSLSVARNPLQSIDLSDNPALEELRVEETKIRSLDLRPCKKLTNLQFDAPLPKGVEILATDKQLKSVEWLVENVSEPPMPKSVAKMTSAQLDRYVSKYNWDDGYAKLAKIASLPNCTITTARRIYWLSEAAEYVDFASAKGASRDDAEILRLLMVIEKRARTGGYAADDFVFDPRDDEGTDWTGGLAAGAGPRELPAPLFGKRKARRTRANRRR